MNIVLKNIVDNNINLQKYTKCSNKNIHSMSWLIDRHMTHSDSIKFGIILENIFREMIVSENMLDIKEKNFKNIKEKDHLFFESSSNTIHYAEIKTNLNLDTEKIKSTACKIRDIHQNLSSTFSNKIIKSRLVCLRYCDEIPNSIKNKYDVRVYSVNEYLRETCVNIIFSDKEYRFFINYIANKMK